MKGVILAGGIGSRLAPATFAVSKQLLPIGQKPLIYYPLSILMLAGIRDVIVITVGRDQAAYRRLLGDGSQFGVRIDYLTQENPDGIAAALLLTEELVAGDSVMLILGDNIFASSGLSSQLAAIVDAFETGAILFAKSVHNPERFGVLSYDADGDLVDIIEKPSEPPSNWAVTGLYIYDDSVFDRIRELKFSPRGELEVTDLNKSYLSHSLVDVVYLGRSFAWFDTGTFASMSEAENYIQAVEGGSGQKIACLEEIAVRNSWICYDVLEKARRKHKNSEYGKYLSVLLNNIDSDRS